MAITFKVGDIVRSKPQFANIFVWFTPDATAKIISLNELDDADMFTGLFLTHPSQPSLVGQIKRAHCLSTMFELVQPSGLAKFIKLQEEISC